MMADRLAAIAGRDVELVRITSHGDVSQESLSSLGGTGVFVSALRDALLADECDVIVHSLKDLPTGEVEGIMMVAIPTREDSRDALCARDGLTLETLPLGASVGTGSPRRRAQLLAARPDLEVHDIRGNVDTRLGKVTKGELDAVILATAGLNRIGRSEVITQHLELNTWPCAPGQGALALETRSDEASQSIAAIVGQIDDIGARVTALAERAVLAGLEAGCAAPVGVTASIFTTFDADTLAAAHSLRIEATVLSLDGQQQVTKTWSGPSDHGQQGAELLVTELLEAGVAQFSPLGPSQ
ncbi:MAG: hydroxymethylbilane synthase [Alpinimonas sp.]|jgi:hydroxymethylbilane synthase